MACWQPQDAAVASGKPSGAATVSTIRSENQKDLPERMRGSPGASTSSLEWQGPHHYQAASTRPAVPGNGVNVSPLITPTRIPSGVRIPPIRVFPVELTRNGPRLPVIQEILT